LVLNLIYSNHLHKDACTIDHWNCARPSINEKGIRSRSRKEVSMSVLQQGL
jgi:hypothetical protein